MTSLPLKITRMIEILHEKGYHDIYLYSGMSPSGLNWRFTIGRITYNSWPNGQHITTGSVRESGEIEWSQDTSTAEILAENFEGFYKPSKQKINPNYIEYVKWYSGLLRILEDDEVPVFYADYEAPHAYLLKYAPFFKK